MSKSIGNVVNPLEYVEKFGTNALRYYLLKEISTTEDGDFSNKKFIELFNSDLANSLGNLVNRVTMMVERYVGGKVPAATANDEVSSQVGDFMQKYSDAFEAFNLKEACEALVDLTNFANKYIDDKKPWSVAKNNPADLPAILYDLLELLRYIATLLLPILPSAAEAIADQLGLKVADLKLDTKWGMMKEGTDIKVTGALFPRIEV
jgi:methionyl-tRNA synthetase